MAYRKKGQLAQIIFPMVDATTGLSIQSSITASDFNSGATCKFWGYNQGGSAATTSGTISKAASLVRSGVFRLTLKGSENNYDAMTVRVVKTGCAEQIYEWDNVDNDDSDLMSAMLVIQSMASDAASAAQQASSRVLVTQSLVSDAYSAIIAPLASMTSDVASAVWAHATGTRVDSRLLKVLSDTSDVKSALAAGNFSIGASATSDIASAVWAHAVGARVDSRVLVNKSVISDVYSAVSDLQSDFQSRVPKRVATDSQLSDMASDIKSAVAGITATISPSDISDIGSQVWANAIGARVDSRLLKVLSDTSDLTSRVPKMAATNSQLSDLASDLRSYLAGMSDMLSNVQSELSDVHSDLGSKIGGITVTVGASDISDIASAVKALLASDISDILSAAQQTNSRVLVVKSTVSDVYSLLSDVQSDFQSRVPKRVATDSQLSDLASDLKSAVGAIAVTVSASDISDIASAVKATLASDLSDMLSAAQQTNSRVLLVQSRVSDVQSFLSDFQSDLVSHLDTTGVGLNASAMSDIRSAVNAVTVNLTASDISDIASAVAAAAVGVTASDISDIASAVWANAVGARVDSRVLKVLSDTSDLVSRTATYASDMSDVLSRTTQINSRVLIAQSAASDAASAAQQANSRVLLNQSRISDVYSLLSDFQSDFQSRVPKAVATNSQLSDLASDLKSYLAGMSGVQSDIYSALIAGVPADASTMSDIRSAITANGVLRNGADPTGVVGTTATLAAKVDWLAAMSRNKLTQTATEQTLYQDDGTTVTASAPVSDDATTFSRNEFA